MCKKTCGQCTYFKKDTRKRYQRKGRDLGWCRCLVPMWAWGCCDPEPDRAASDYDATDCAAYMPSLDALLGAEDAQQE